MKSASALSPATSSPEESPFRSDKIEAIAAHHYSETADFQRMRASSDEAITQGVSKVLVIYTGGTIGMKHDKCDGYSPVKGYLPEKLRSIDRFHDPDGFRDFGIEFHRSVALGNTPGKSDDTAPGMRRSSQLQQQQQPKQQQQPQQQQQQRALSATRPANTNTLVKMAKRRLKDMARNQQRLGPRVSDSEASTESHPNDLGMGHTVQTETESEPADSEEMTSDDAPASDLKPE
ncbi:hypothetical protein GGI23_004020, partial [Coemansia sp. RSA 2559]